MISKHQKQIMLTRDLRSCIVLFEHETLISVSRLNKKNPEKKQKNRQKQN